MISFRFCLSALVVSVMFISCTSEKQPPASESDASATERSSEIPTEPNAASVSESNAAENDTVTISGKFVLFFGPTQERIMAIREKGSGQDDIEKMAAAHLTSARLVMDSLGAAGFPGTGYRDCRYIRVEMQAGQTMIIDRYKLKSEIGFYLTDGYQIPIFRLGPVSTDEMHRVISKFYNLK